MDRQELLGFLIAHFSESELRNLCFELHIEYDDLRGESRSDKARELVAYCERHGRLTELSAACQRLRSEPFSKKFEPQPNPNPPRSSKLFICYKRHSEQDSTLANYLHTSLSAEGHTVFIDTTMRVGAAWLEQIDQEIKNSDFMIVLLSQASVDSEMVRAEVMRAAEYRSRQGRPQVLPVRVAYEGQLPYAVSAFLTQLQYVAWNGEGDNEHVLREIQQAIDGNLPSQMALSLPPLTRPPGTTEDGRQVANPDELHPPSPEFDPRVLDELETPGGTVKLSDRLYVRRTADDTLKREVAKLGTTTIIRAARQTGKSSLLIRGIQHTRERGAKVVFVDLQPVEENRLSEPDTLLRQLAEYIVQKLRLDIDVAKRWQSALPPQEKLTSLMEECVLPASTDQIIFALDEADRFLGKPMSKDFFGLMRAWHNNRAMYDDWNKLNIVLVISTEPYLLINDISQSPFNVGMTLYMADFNTAQVTDLNRRHGSPVREPVMPQMMDLLNGHPYLTRKALYTLVTEKMTWADLTLVAADDQGPFGDHLRHHYWLLRNEQGLRDALKQVIRENRCKDELAFFRLLQAGLVKGSGDVCKCRCGLYEMYFKDRL